MITAIRAKTILACLVAASFTLTALAAETRPNLLHIVADDLGWKDVGFNGCADIKTPNLDKLCTGGVKLTQFYVQPMCTPTRAALMTGRYPFRYGLQTAVIPSVSTYGLDTTEWLLPQALKEAGYKTAIIGKWHLGHADKKFWPRQRGFDYQYGAMIGELDYFTHEEQGVLDWYRDNKPVREKGYTTTLLGNDAVKYIEAQNPATPFYLYLTFNAPHTPYQAPKEYVDRYADIADPTRRTYAGMVACLDDNIGRVVAALNNRGLGDNTLILFHSDNGGTRNAMFSGVMADVTKIKLPCDNGPYREGKGTLFDGACRVCACANWPGHIKPGSTVDGMIHAVDLYPTLAALAGASTAMCKPLDGLNVWDTIAEGKPSPRTELVYNIEPFRAGLRQG
ncbi:MAG: arylsulfatase, partial [Verrucomicrobia bacterium]|nr:arylsulfatase [Verrucomicrobiota bacterium]